MTLVKTTSKAIEDLTLSIDGNLLDDFIAYLDVAPKSIRTYKTNLKRFADYMAENDISQPTRQDILAYRDYLKANYKPSTVQGYLGIVKQLFEWLELRGLYPNVAKNIKGAKIDRGHKKDYLTPDQVNEVLSKIDRREEKGKRDYAMFTLMVTCGLRTIEVSRANIEDIRPLGYHTVLYIQGKGKDDKTSYVKIEANTARALKDYLASRPTAKPEEPLFTSTSNNNKGQRMTTRSISGTIKSLLKSVGLDSERLTAHSLRHTAVTLALIGGNTVQEAQQFARHATPSTTLVYAHNLERQANKCSNTIEQALFG